MNEKHGISLFLTACLCGCGQMHQGYMKRGLSLLLLFFVLLAASGFLAMGALAFFLPVVWLYAFFDAYNLRSQIAAGSAPPDTFLFGLSEMDQRRLSELMCRRHSAVGWALVAVGAYLLYDALMGRMGWALPDWAYSLLRYDLPRMVLTVLIILLGIWFIRGPRKTSPDEEIPDFVPPEPEGAPESGEEVERHDP